MNQVFIALIRNIVSIRAGGVGGVVCNGGGDGLLGVVDGFNRQLTLPCTTPVPRVPTQKLHASTCKWPTYQIYLLYNPEGSNVALSGGRNPFLVA